MTSSARPPARSALPVFRPFLWRGAAFALVYLAAVVGFASGVGATERDITASGLATEAYYALGLFVLGGLDIGTPVGGPPLGRALLWTAYFLAPTITASALIEAAVRIMSPLAWRIRPYSRHVVLGGAGRLTLLYVRALRARDPRRTVVVVEKEAGHPAVRELRQDHRAIVVTGDVTSDDVLRRLRIGRAHRVLLLTGDDFANLDAAARVLRMAPHLSGRIVAHVSDLGFIRETADTSVARACEIFNGHEFAATTLVRDHLLRRFRDTPQRDLVVLGGFGRFGQTVLHQLQEHALGSFGCVVIIDAEAGPKTRAFGEEPGFSGDYRRIVSDGDLLDPRIWRSVAGVADEEGQEPVVILGSGADGTNLHAALMVRKQHPDALVIVRSFAASPFTEEVARDARVHAFVLAELIRNGMPEHWF